MAQPQQDRWVKDEVRERALAIMEELSLAREDLDKLVLGVRDVVWCW